MIPSQPIQHAWHFCPRCGATATLTGGHPFTCTNCNYTHYFSPCTAVGALIADSKNRMLFIVRGKNPGKGKLGLPGGFVDANETAEHALLREVKEELNLNIARLQYLASFPNEYAFCGVTIPVTDLFFVAHVDSFDDMVAQEGEIHAWNFLPTDKINLDMLAFKTHEQALTAYISQPTDE